MNETMTLDERTPATGTEPASERVGRGARPAARSATPARHRGARERGGSAWLGGRPAPSDPFEQYRVLDRTLLSSIGQATGGIAPVTVAAALQDWWAHWLVSPAKQLEVAQFITEAAARLSQWACSGGAAQECPLEPLPQDKRFNAPAWQQWPFRWWAQSFQVLQHAWQHATSGVPGVSRHHEAMVAFGARQWLDLLSPSNGPLTNPVVLERTLAEGGANLARGALYAYEDAVREALALPPPGSEKFVVGGNVAVTPGQVVHRNRLAELIRYEPTTPTAHPEPVLLVPAWIMKYYILDLSPANSLVKALVDAGFTVFALSWKNPGPEDRETTFDDYYRLGLEAALDTIAASLPGTPPVHAVGYCLGGTLLSAGAAVLAKRRPKALKSMTLFAAQTDFTDPGELGLFIDEGQVELLDDVMWRQGVLESSQMKRTFQVLRSQDLIWSYRVINYLLGERPPVSDLMAWNADGTRLPYRMHSQYLHRMFLDNALATGRLPLDGQRVSLADIRVPVFAVAAVQDHVAPWRSVFKLHALADTEITFALTAGGHNVGIVNPPGAARTSHRLARWRPGEPRPDADGWLAATPQVEGSWWTPWFAWLRQHSSPRVRAPGMPAASLGPAPGTYVLAR